MTQERDLKMAQGTGEHTAHPHPTRPLPVSHHSSSVPSTPFQQARDLRFHSRSPSPRFGLRSHSPQSVASEAVERAGSQKVVPLVCKFESGAEIKRRRIPYKDDGNQELAPPKVEPKKSLDPDEEKKLSGDMRELYDRLLPSAESEDRRAKLVKKLERILNEEWPNSDIRVNVFGSSGNLLSSSDSDVDICITTPLKTIESMHAIAHLLHKNGMQKVICRASAKVPIVKCWDPELDLFADLNVNNPLALENTRMIKTYVQLDDRVRPLAKIIKYWTKRRFLNDAAFGGTISSYTWICMILSFLQRRDPPILPSLQKTKGKRRATEDSAESAFADDLDALKASGNANTESQAQLLFHFFRHYGYEFDYAKHVVSVREGRLVTRKEKGWHPSNYQEKEARNRLCVEEPFTINRNLGNSADDYAWSGIHTEIRRAFDLIAQGKLDEAFEEYVFPPEEKTIFQKPAPKAPVTLRRSASQTNRPNQDSGQTRSRKSNRNQSAQRAGNRRASSGASFNNGRVPYFGYPISPLGIGPLDFLAAKGNLHDQLFQQYQFLQAQQDALRSQLAAREQAQAQSRAGVDMASTSHRIRTNGLQNVRYMDAPSTAPLLPGSLFHYSHPLVRTVTAPHSSRAREGANTNPSSPSSAHAVPALRRQAHRASVAEGNPGSTRSQSQPGRSLPHPLHLQQHVHPGYDVSGTMPATQAQYMRSAQPFTQTHPGLHLPFSPLLPTHHLGETAMPKEYLGYTMTPSPQLTPQQLPQMHFASNHFAVPTMNLRDPPFQRPRRVTPEHGLGLPNGLSSSRSPSPLSHAGHNSQSVESRTSPSTGVQSPATAESLTSGTSGTAPTDPEIGGPVIVNGSDPVPSIAPDQVDVAQAVSVPGTTTETIRFAPGAAPTRTKSLPVHPPEHGLETPPRITPGQNTKTSPRLHMGANGSPAGKDRPQDITPVPAPLLSPVAEMRTPSPTHAQLANNQESPRTNSLVKSAQIASAKQTERSELKPWTHAVFDTLPSRETNTNALPPAKPTTTPPSWTTPPTDAEIGGLVNTNPWQQATRKGHKKSKSLGGHKTMSGQPLPASLADRKGG